MAQPIERVEHDVEEQRHRFDNALERLEDRFSSTVYKLRAPERWARKNPYATAAIFLVAGFVFGMRTRFEPNRGIRRGGLRRETENLRTSAFDRVRGQV